MTDCGHSFCERCLINFVSGKLNWNCPVSRRCHNRNVKLLPRNFVIESLVESIKPQQAKRQSPKKILKSNAELFAEQKIAIEGKVKQ